MAAGDFLRAGTALGAGRRLGNQRQNRVEDASLSGPAADADPSAHHLHDPFSERKPETGARILLCRGGIQLLKLDEEPADVFRLNADAGIFDRETKVLRTLGHDSHYNLASVRREFDGVERKL